VTTGEKLLEEFRRERRAGDPRLRAEGRVIIERHSELSTLIVVDEYLAIRALVGDLPAGVPDDFLGIPVSSHWRLLQRLHSRGNGQLSQLLAKLPESDREAIRSPHPHVLEILDPRPYLDEAARIQRVLVALDGLSQRPLPPLCITVDSFGMGLNATSAYACGK
jgi:hypothetical protein